MVCSSFSSSSVSVKFLWDEVEARDMMRLNRLRQFNCNRTCISVAAVVVAIGRIETVVN